MRYQVNAPTVISETIGGETIVVNLSTGSYYSLQGTGVEIWEGVVRGEAASQIAARLRAGYAGSGDEVEAAVDGLLDELEREELIVPSASVAPVGSVAPPPSLNGHRKAFAPPGLHKFTDMQDIIMLDPVHEVDDRGWPHAAPGRSMPPAV